MKKLLTLFGVICIASNMCAQSDVNMLLTMDSAYLALYDVKNDSTFLERRIKEYVRNANKAEKNGRIGDALRYLYAAKVFISDLPNATTFTCTVNTPDGTKDVFAAHYIQHRIVEVLDNIEVVFDGFLPNSTTDGKLNFLYNYSINGNSRKVAISNLNFTYEDNTGCRKYMSATDGWSVVSLTDQNTSEIKICIEYRYTDESCMDIPLWKRMQKYHFDFDKNALRNIPVVSSTANWTTRDNLPAEASATYDSLVNRVLDAIESGHWTSVFNMFTSNGYHQFQNMIVHGKPRIVTRSTMRYVTINGTMQCRHIPVLFAHKGKKYSIEKLIFTFDNQQKIDGVQFALEERTIRNIMADKRYSENTALMLIDFLEKYRTAYMFKSIDHILSVVDSNYRLTSMRDFIQRLNVAFSLKGRINLEFNNLNIEPTGQGEGFGISFLQEYFSAAGYGNRGYLFLLVDFDSDVPITRFCVWQPELAGDSQFTLSDYDELTTKSLTK